MENKTENEILAFIHGVQASYELGDVIDDDKQLSFEATKQYNQWHISAKWILEIKKAPIIDNPIYQLEDVILYDTYTFKLFFTESERKAAKEIHGALDYINSQSLIII